MIISTATFSELDISSFADSAFTTTFHQNFKGAMASAAGVSTSDVTIVSITAGSVIVSSITYFAENTSPSMFATLLSGSPSSVFSSVTFGNVTASASATTAVSPTAVSPTASPTAAPTSGEGDGGFTLGSVSASAR
jgi:hypothetical protein